MLSGDVQANQNRDLASIEADQSKLMAEIKAMKDVTHPDYKAKKEQLNKLFTEGANVKFGG